jgi:hypothetical protein
MLISSFKSTGCEAEAYSKVKNEVHSNLDELIIA